MAVRKQPRKAASTKLASAKQETGKRRRKAASAKESSNSEDFAKVPRDAVKANDAPPARDRGGYDGDTAFKLYLREIGQVQLLTPAEEIDLAAKIRSGRKVDEAGSRPHPSARSKAPRLQS